MYIDRIDINEPLGGGVVSRSFKVFNDKDFDEKSLPIKDSIEDLSSKSTKVINSWPVTGHGTHLVMDDKGLKAVTSWDEERGYRRIIYNRDPVLYIEASGPDQVKLNGEMVDLVEGSNYFEVEEITRDSAFGNENPNHVTDVIVRCKIPSDLSSDLNFYNNYGIFRCMGSLNSIELPIDNSIINISALISGIFAPWANPMLIPVKYINTSTWDTSNITNISGMFSGCSSLQSLDVSNWDVSNVTSMNSMFSGCSSLQSLDVSNWDTSNVTGMGSMFDSCSSLQSLDLSNWDVSNVTSMNSMFYGCNKLTSLDVSNWDTSKVTSMNSMFAKKVGLKNISLPLLNTTNSINLGYIFDDCPYLEKIDFITPIDSNIYINSINIRDCPKLLNITGIDKLCMENHRCDDGFCNNPSLTSLNLHNLYLLPDSNCTILRMFRNCSSLTYLDLTNFDIADKCAWPTGVNSIFYGCYKLTDLIWPLFGHILSTTTINELSTCPLNHDSLMSIFTYDRTSNGLSTLTVKLHPTSKGYLTNEEKAAITAKGYTIA